VCVCVCVCVCVWCVCGVCVCVLRVCVCMCVLKTLTLRLPKPEMGCLATKKIFRLLIRVETASIIGRNAGFIKTFHSPHFYDLKILI
jgi:hypothetical protein